MHGTSHDYRMACLLAAAVILKPLLTCQKATIRMIAKSKNPLQNTKELFAELEILPLNFLYEKTIICFFLTYARFNERSELNRRTRQDGRGMYVLPKYDKSASRQSIRFKSIAIFNELTRKNPDVSQILTKGKTKKSKELLKLYLFEKFLNSQN